MGKIEKLFNQSGFILNKTKTINIGPRDLKDFFNHKHENPKY